MGDDRQEEKITLITDEQLTNWFRHHPPKDEATAEKYAEIRKCGFMLAQTIAVLTPPGADQTAAIRKVREAVMTANAAIACEGK